MSLRQDESGVSEIVGALLLVVIVSSAAFGFGLFVHQQAKLTQAQKALETERRLEVLEITGLAPVATDFADADCILDAGAADWNTITIAVTSRHLKDTEVSALQVNGLVAKFAKVGATTHDFSLLPDDPAYAPLVIPARSSVSILLENVADDSTGGDGCAPAYSFFPTTPLAAAPLPSTGALDIEVLTARGNGFQRAFIPPSALASLEATAGVANSMTLVGTASQPGSAGAFLVKWTWSAIEADSADCLANPVPLAPTNTHRAQITTQAAKYYCIALTVTDNAGLAGTTQITFDTV